MNPVSFFHGVYPILRKRALAKEIYDLTLHAPDIAMAAQPGQFVHIRVDGFQLRRPISICEADPCRSTLRIVFEVRGDGTKALSQLPEGALLDLLGPLGKGFDILPGGKAVAVGGGIGVPPMLAAIQPYGNDGTVICGFRSATAVILQEDFVRAGAQTLLCTDDGTAGRKGFVTAALDELLRTEKPDIIYACGPQPMLKGVVALAQAHSIRCQVSLEERMGCGVGACLVCGCKAVKDGEEYIAHVCKDGPVFDSDAVIL